MTASTESSAVCCRLPSAGRRLLPELIQDDADPVALELGRNTLGALLTRGLAEITRLGVALGAQMETFLGLAGVGDLVTTCTSPLSRNNQLGRLLAQGHSLDAALGKMTMVAEGVRTTRAAVSLAADKGIEVPILAQVERILFHGLDPAEAIDALMTRPLRAE